MELTIELLDERDDVRIQKNVKDSLYSGGGGRVRVIRGEQEPGGQTGEVPYH
jgi:hypothetical protein